MSFGMPHRANLDEIIRVKGYDGLYLVTAWYEEVTHRREGIEEVVSYDCVNVDNYKDLIIVFDQDVSAVVVKADKSDKFIEERQGGALPPSIIKPPDMTMGMMEAFYQITHGEELEETPQKQALSKHEQERADRKEAQRYVDYLLDLYAMLATVEAEIGGDETRQEEMRIIKEEFDATTAQLRS